MGKLTKEAIFRLNLYANSKGIIDKKLNTENIIYSLTDQSKSIIFDLDHSIIVPNEGLFLGIEFIGFEDSNNAIIEDERNNYIKFCFNEIKPNILFK